MGMDKHGKSQVINLIVSAVFIIAGLFLAMHYLLEFPDPQVHWEGVGPLIGCLFYYVFW